MSDAQAAVQLVELPTEILDLAVALNTGIAVLPIEVADGKGVYSEPSVMLVKELRALGAEAEFAHSSEQRVFEVKKSAEVLIAYVVGIASTASWDLMTRLLRRRKDSRLSVTFLELEDGKDQRGSAWKVEGDADSVIRAIGTLRAGPPSAEPIEDGPD